MVTATGHSGFTSKFRAILDAAGESQSASARRLGYTHGWISQVVNGGRPSREFVDRVADVYGADRDELLSLAGFDRQAYRDPVTEAAELAAKKAVQAMVAQLFREREEQPRDYYHRRLGEITALCADLGVDFSPPRFHGGTESLSSREQVDGVIEGLVAGLIEDYPEHADSLRSGSGVGAADAAEERR